MDSFRRPTSFETRVRNNSMPAAFAAGVLLLFGFFAGLVIPEVTDLFSRANVWLVYTLRAGGIAMVLVAIWSSFGHSPALMVDAVISIAIGVMLLLTGIMMISDGGGELQFVINILAGMMFLVVGVRNGRDYSRFVHRKVVPEATAMSVDEILEHRLKSEARGASGSHTTPIEQEMCEPVEDPVVCSDSSGKPKANISYARRYTPSEEPIHLDDSDENPSSIASDGGGKSVRPAAAPGKGLLADLGQDEHRHDSA